MRGSAAPTVDTKYGFPLHGTESPAARGSRDDPRQRTTPGAAFLGGSRRHISPPPQHEPHRPRAPLYSPEGFPQTPDMYPPPLNDEDLNLSLTDHDSAGSTRGDLRAPSDIHMQAHHPPPAEAAGAVVRVGSGAGAVPADAGGVAYQRASPHSPPPPRQEIKRTPSGNHLLGVGSSVPLPRDVVTSMALALGAPARPARAGPANGSSKRQNNEVFVSAPVSGGRFGDSVQSFGRMCDLLFFGDELPIPLAMVEVLPANGAAIGRAKSEQHWGYGGGALGQERLISSLFHTFCANDQMHRLLRACAQQQIRQTRTRKEILRDECACKRVITSYVSMTAGDYFRNLLDPTLRALQGPWTANEAGLKGALDRLLSRLASTDAPHDMRVALKTVYACIAKKYGSRAISTLACLLVGELFADTIRNLVAGHVVESLTPEGARFLESMAKVLSKLSLNESFAGDSKLYHMNSWIQSRYENFEKSMDKILGVDEPAIVPWNSGCTVQGSIPNLHVLLRALTEHKEEITRYCMSLEWSQPSTQQFYQSRFPILWTALESGRRRSNTESSTGPQHSRRADDVSPLKERESNRMHGGDAHTLANTQNGQPGLLGQMVNMVIKPHNASQMKPVKVEGGASRMEQLQATVTDMDLDSRDLVTVPNLDHFKNLQILNIPRNRIQQLGDMPSSLRTLDCSHNLLSTLNGVEFLLNLETLNASHNVLQDVRGGLANSTQVISLNLSHNRLDCVLDFSHMSGLRHLFLDHNRMGALQDLRLVALNPNLVSLCLKGNPMCEEANYVKQAATMLPQVETIDQVSVVIAQFRPTEAGKSPFLYSLQPSPYDNVQPSPCNKPALSPFINPLTPSPKRKGITSGRIPEMERDAYSPRVSPIPRQENGANVGASNAGASPHLRASAHLLSMNQSELAQSQQAENATPDAEVAMHSLSFLAPRMPQALAERLDSPLIGGRSYMEESENALWQGLLDYQGGANMSRDFWEQSNTNAHRNASSHAKSRSPGASPPRPRGSKPSAIQMLAQVAMAEAAMAQVELYDRVGPSDAPPRHHVSLTGTGRIATAVTPRTAPTRMSSHTDVDDDAGTHVHIPSSVHASSKKSPRPAESGTGTVRQSQDSHSSSRTKHATTRIAASKISPPKPPKTSLISSDKASTSKKSSTLSAKGSISKSLTPPSSRVRALSTSHKNASTYLPVDMAEMVIEVNNALKTMCITFRGWKLVMAYSRIANYLAHPACSLVLVTRSHYSRMTLRLVFEAWADIKVHRLCKNRHVDKRENDSRIRMVRQLLHEWAAISHFQKMFGLRVQRWLDIKVVGILKGWRQAAVYSMDKKAVVYKIWRRRVRVVMVLYLEEWKKKQEEAQRLEVVKRRICRMLMNRQLDTTFEAFVELRERAHGIECDVAVAVKRIQQDLVCSAVIAWRHMSSKKIHVNKYVSQVCSTFFTVNLESHFAAWSDRIANKSRLSSISGRLENNAQRKAARAALTRLARYRDLRVYHKGIVLKIQRLRRSDLLRAWRLVVAGTDAQNRLVKLALRRRQAVVKNTHLQMWFEHCEKHKRQADIEDSYEAMMAKRASRFQAKCFYEWIHMQTVTRQYSLLVLRALHRRRRRLIHVALARLRTKALFGKTRQTIDVILFRKVSRHFARAHLDCWRHTARQREVLRRREPVIAVRRIQCEMRAVLYTWHEVAHRRFQVAAMLDKILLKRKHQHLGSPGELLSEGRTAGPRLNLSSASRLSQSPRQPSTSPRHSDTVSPRNSRH